MVNTRLILINEQNISTEYNNNTHVIDNIAIDVTLQISDVRNPEKREGSFSKSVNIAGTGETNNFFENVFLANVDLQTYDPRKKVKAIYYVNEIVNFIGYLRITKIDVDNYSNRAIYR
jgi:hypothetical protein